MSYRRVPAKITFFCDSCSAETESMLPDDWSRIEINSNEHGNLLYADICAVCSKKVLKALQPLILAEGDL